MHYYSQVILTDGSWHCKPAHISDSDREDSHGNPKARDSPVGCHLSNHYLFKANKNGCFILLFSCLPCLPLYTQVNNKRRSPPSDRPSLGAHLSTHHSISTDDQDSPERIVRTTNIICERAVWKCESQTSLGLTSKFVFKVQKEKLHAELKQVLSQKRSQLRDTQSTLTDMEEPPKTDSKNVVRIKHPIIWTTLKK